MVTRCGDGGVVVEQHAAIVSRLRIQLFAGWLTWTRGRIAKAFQPGTGRRMRWHVPGDPQGDTVAVHTSNRIFVADIVAETDYAVPTRIRIYQAKLG